jgi:hypothetical protein
LKITNSIGKLNKLLKKTVNKQKVNKITMASTPGSGILGKSLFSKGLASGTGTVKASGGHGTSAGKEARKSSLENLSRFSNMQIFSSQNVLCDASQFSYPSSPGVTPFDLGVEWLTGIGSRHRDFTNGDILTEMLRKHDHILATKSKIAGKIASGQLSGDNPYRLSGIQGVGNYVKDYSTLTTFGLTGNLAVTYLGSYALHWEVKCVKGNSALVFFVVQNTSSFQSATRPPVLGYTSWWQNSVGSWLNQGLAIGPMSPTTQTFRWIETISW